VLSSLLFDQFVAHFLAGAETSSLQHQPRILHPVRETPSETMLDDQGAPKPHRVRLDVLINPFFALKRERAEQENGAFILNENVKSKWDNW